MKLRALIGRIVNIANGGGATMLPYFSAYV